MFMDHYQFVFRAPWVETAEWLATFGLVAAGALINWSRWVSPPY